MRRPLFLFSISLSFGILLGYLFNSYIFIFFTFLFLLISGILLFKKLKSTFLIFMGCLIFFLIGAIEYIYVNNLNIEKFKDFSGKQTIVVGNVVSEPDYKELKVNYIIKTKTIFIGDTASQIKGRILFSTLKSDKSFYDLGQEIRIEGILTMPKGKRNPGGFNYQRYLSQSGVSATIFAKSTNVKIGNISNINPLIRAGLEIRNRIIQVIQRSLPTEQAGLLNGMLIGYTGGLDKALQAAFSDAGLSHIMAVSGMNVAFIVLPLVFIFKKFRMRQNTSNVLIILILILFVYVTGFSASVVRAVIMAIIILVGQIIMREADVITSLSLAALILLLYNPVVLLDVGFQLSFAATFSLILFYKVIKSMLSFRYFPKFLVDLLAVTISAQIGVLPITAFYFNKISIISVFTNILVVPLTGVVTILGFIMAILGQINIYLSQLIGYINYAFLTFILFITKISANLPFAIIKVITPHVSLIILYYAIVFFFLWLKPKMGIKLKQKYLIASVCIILIVFCLNTFYLHGLEVVFIDVGEGDSTFIRTAAGRTILIDGGGIANNPNPDSNIGETTIIPFLLDYGVSKLDMVIATHGHEDHIQGLLPVIEGFSVSNFIIPDVSEREEFKQLIDLSNKRGIKVNYCHRGEKIILDKYTYFDVLHPLANYKVDKVSLNNSSLVLKLNYKKVSILFTGDIESEVENLLIENNENLASDFLKVAHHGSVYSTSESFLEKVKPSAAIISVGKNTFGHPAPDVINRLKQAGVHVFRTDESGAIIVESNGKMLNISKMIN